jgi:hypothetical protein
MQINPSPLHAQSCSFLLFGKERAMRTVTTIKVGTLALGIVLAVPAFAQEVWQTYPMTISTPAFGRGPVAPGAYYVAPRRLYNVSPYYAAPYYVAPRRLYNVAPHYAARRRLYNVAPPAAAAAHLCEVWQTYPMTISTPAFGHYVESCR